MAAKEGPRRRFGGAVKVRVALEALREQKTVAEIASAYQCHPTQVSKWKKEAVEGLPAVFSSTTPAVRAEDKLVAELYEQIGRLKMELEWFKKKFGHSS